MINWDNLLQALREDKLVLLLGPDLFEVKVKDKTQGLHSFLADTILQQHKNDLIAHYEQDGLFLFRKDSAKNESYFTLKGALQKHPVKGDLLRQITALPIHLMLSFSPYLNPTKTFPRLEIPYLFQHEFYHMKRGGQAIDAPTAERPLLYEMFGSIEEEESLILTHDDLFDYIRSILGAKELDLSLKSVLQKARYFIFLGFPFEKWYVQIMLRLLSSINDQHSAYTWVSQDTEKADAELDFISNEFDIRIIRDQSGAAAFVERLHEACSKQGILRQNPSEGQGPHERIKSMLGQDQLEAALEYMMDYLESRDEDLFDDSLSLNARLNRLSKKESQGIMTKEEVEVGRNKIGLAIRTLNEEIAQL